MSATTNEKTVRDFCAAWERLDVEAVLGFMSADAVYHNMPLPPLTGQSEIRAFLQGFFAAATRCRFELLTVVADATRVVTERLDSFGFPDKNLDRLPVLGIFEFDANGKIQHWREYFDLKTWVDKGGPAIG
ncbi:MAG: nuclear transport factor 2 family protein [Porticoccaceae bacterium]